MNLSRFIPKSRVTKINIAFVVIVFAGLYGFVVAKQAVDKNRFAMMKSKQRIYEARMHNVEEKFGKVSLEEK